MTEDSLRKAHILMVDDEVSSLCMLENILNRLGFTNIRKLKNPLAVAMAMVANPPDVIITDLSMPEMDGIDLIAQIRVTYPDNLALPIIVLSGSATPQNKRKALAAGATDILHKPLDSAEILMRIRGVLRSRFLHLALQNQNALLEEKVAERTKELRDSQHQVVQRERFRAFGEMASGVVHDFNNALVAVIGYSELLLGDESLLRDPEMVREHLQIMLTAGRDATHVVARLRDFYRPREESDVFTALDLNKLISEAVALAQPKWREQVQAKGLRIEVALELEKVPFVAGNGAELREVLMNLIFNAVDAMPGGGKITIRSRQNDGDVLIEVADTGKGMPEEVRQRCFEPFFTTKGEAGTGLGLAMVFGILKRHDAVIDVESAPGKGTNFHLRFAAMDRVEHASAECRIEKLPSLHVLVVDDDPVARDVIGKYLRSDGHEVECAASGEDALARLMTDGIELLITDYGMPGMNGTQLAQAARERGHGQPVILMSCFGIDPREKPDFIRGLLRKPIQQQELRKLLSEIPRISKKSMAVV
jgi:signal transduction histidine kinase